MANGDICRKCPHWVERFTLFDKGRVATLMMGCAMPPSFWLDDRKYHGKEYVAVRNAIRRGRLRDSSKSYCVRKDPCFNSVVECVRESYDGLRKFTSRIPVPEQCPYRVEQEISEWNDGC